MIRRPPRSTRTDTLFPTRRSSDLHRHWPVLADKLSLQREIDGAAIDGIWIVAQQRIIWTVEPGAVSRSEEHTSELQSLMRISYAVFCLKKKKTTIQNTLNLTISQ